LFLSANIFLDVNYAREHERDKYKILKE